MRADEIRGGDRIVIGGIPIVVDSAITTTHNGRPAIMVDGHVGKTRLQMYLQPDEPVHEVMVYKP